MSHPREGRARSNAGGFPRGASRRVWPRGPTEPWSAADPSATRALPESLRASFSSRRAGNPERRRATTFSAKRRVRKLGWAARQARTLGLAESVVERGELAHQNVHGPAVRDDV